jgi:hypothetical protein
MAFTPFKFEHGFVSDFIRDHEAGVLIKPRLQRKLTWKRVEMTKFILFMIQHGGSTQNMYVNEQPNKKRCIFDGNNRGNSIADFCKKPLDFLPETIPTEFSFAEPLLKTIPLQWFVNGIEDKGKNRPFSYQRFTAMCKKKEIVLPDGEEMESIWEDLVSTIKSWDFFNLKVAYVNYYNLSNEEMCDIYESINTGGKVLTKQELLASVTAFVVYKSEDVPKHYHDLKTIIQEYYHDMNESECFQMNEEITSLNTYEVLLASQKGLYKQYSFMKLVSSKKEIDILFTLYENRYGQFTEKVDIQVFIDELVRACVFLQKVLDSMFHMCFHKKIPQMKKNTALTCLSMILYGEPTKEMMYTMLLIHYLCPEDKSKTHDILRWRPGGKEMPKLLKDIKDCKTLDVTYTREKTLEILLLSIIIQPTEDRKDTTLLEMFALTAFFQQNVPEKVKQLPHDIDHIVPFSLEGDYDKCRLGNKQIIPASINRARGVKPITDKWICDNDLTHQYYPSEEVYAGVCQGKVVNADAYNAMCETREKMYLDNILKNCI